MPRRLLNMPLQLGALLLGLIAVPASSQTPDPLVNCDSAIAIVSRGRVAAADRWAYLFVPSCGVAGASAVVAGMNALRAVNDTMITAEFMRNADNWRDAQVLNAASAIAQDASASRTMRVFAIRHLLIVQTPMTRYDYADLTASHTVADSVVGTDTIMTAVGRKSCVSDVVASQANYSATPLPTGTRGSIKQTLKAIHDDPATPGQVKRAAQCGL